MLLQLLLSFLALHYYIILLLLLLLLFYLQTKKDNRKKYSLDGIPIKSDYRYHNTKGDAVCRDSSGEKDEGREKERLQIKLRPLTSLFHPRLTVRLFSHRMRHSLLCCCCLLTAAAAAATAAVFSLGISIITETTASTMMTKLQLSQRYQQQQQHKITTKAGGGAEVGKKRIVRETQLKKQKTRQKKSDKADANIAQRGTRIH